MLDLPLFIAVAMYIVLGFALGLGVYFSIKHPRFRFLLIVWFPVAVVGIACINFTIYAINAFFRVPEIIELSDGVVTMVGVTAGQNLLDNVLLFSAALFGMAFSHWLIWEDYKHLLNVNIKAPVKAMMDQNDIRLAFGIGSDKEAENGRVPQHQAARVDQKTGETW